MSGFIADNSSYNISTDYLMSTILSHFDESYIYTTIKNWIQLKYQEPMFTVNNIVFGYEENFKQLSYMYENEDDRSMIADARNRVYKDIITLLCNEFQLEANLEVLDNDDLYVPAFFLFRLLVSEFMINVKNFFVNYIIKECDQLYDFLNLDRFKKEKDSTTIYNKKNINNPKLAIIISRLNYVISNICVMDIPFDLYIRNIGYDQNTVNYILSIIGVKNDFFKTYVAPIFDRNSMVRPFVVSSISIDLYNIAGGGIEIEGLIDEQ